MKLKYAAKVDHVRETTLRGLADLAPWQAQLAARGLTAVNRDGRAELMLSATDAKFAGIRFRECSICALVRENESGAEGWFMAHAFNSSRLFAWCERAFFATPYYTGAVESNATPPAKIEASADRGQFRAAMDASMRDREPSRRGHESWRGPIFLPSPPSKPTTIRKLFYTALSGDTQAFPFMPDRDELAVTPTARWPIFAALAESLFTGVEWLLRADASHAKSHTYEGAAQEVTW